MFGKAKTRHRGSSGPETFRPSHRPAARAAAVLLSLSVAFTMMPTPVFAVTQERAAETGLCEHHPEHDGECGYQEGEPGHPCEHNRHTVDCYTDVLICGYIEDEDMTASDSDAHHKHTQDCYELDCPHERGEHGADGSEANGEGGLGNEENCGYIEAVEGTPCGYVCGQCDNPDKIGGNGNTNGGNNLPVPEGTGPELIQPDGKEGMTVTAFDRLDEAVQNQTVKEGTTLEELALPKTLSATAQAAGEEPEPVVIDGVAWEPDVLYEGAAGSYVFTASAAGYIPAQGVDWPVIIVTVEEGMPTLDEIDALCAAIDDLPTVEELYENAPGDADPEFDDWVTETSAKLAEVPALWEQFLPLSEDEAAMERITGARAEKLAALNNLVVRLGEMVTLEGITSVDALNQEIISSAGTAKNPTVITIDGAGITVNQSIVIDNKHIKLTGGTLARAESYTGNLIEVKKGGSLTLEDITLDGNKDNASGGGLINLNKAALILEDGATLTNNQGGAINIGYHFSGSSSITMNGGVISNNVSEDGGAIKDSDANTVITIKGGEITGNEANGTDTDSTYGGAIFSSGNLIIEGGTITGNSTAQGRGGGIFKTGGNDRKFIVTGGTISGNTAREGDHTGGNGHNVYVNQCAFTMGGEANIPDGLYLKLGGNYSTFTIASALQNPVEIEGIYDHPQVGTLVASGAAGDSAYTITDGDVAKFSYKGNAFSFALENNQIKLAEKSAPSAHTHAMSVDCSTADGTQVEFLPWSAADALPPASGNYYLENNVTIADDWTLNSGEDVNLCLNGQTVNVSDGKSLLVQGTLQVCDCNAESGGQIKGSYGGGAASSALVETGENGTFFLYGGNVLNEYSGNLSNHSAVSVQGGTLGIFGGEIKSTGHCAVYVDGQSRELQLSGAPGIIGEGADSDIYLNGGNSKIILTGSLEPKSPYRVSADATKVFTTGWSTHMGNKDVASSFRSATKGMFISQNSDELEFAEYAITEQPKAENSYTVTANGAPHYAPDGYQWLAANVEKDVEVTEDEADAVLGASYNSENGWTGKLVSPEARYFDISLLKGDTLNVNPLRTASIGGVVLGGKNGAYVSQSIADVNGIYTLTAPADDTYTLTVSVPSADFPNVKATVTRTIIGAAVDGQTTAQLTDVVEGSSYLCQVTYEDGTVLRSDVVTYGATDDRPAWADSGDGTSADTAYVISSYENLAKFAANVGGTGAYEGNANNFAGQYIKLTNTFPADSGSLVTPIGTSIANEFKGHFNGSGRTVNLSLTDSQASSQGLFQSVGEGGVVEDVIVTGEVTGTTNVGGVTAVNSGTVENCVNQAEITGTNYVGGVAGENLGTIKSCYNTGTVTGESQNIGGVTGKNVKKVQFCYNTGTVTSTGENVGGIVGHNCVVGNKIGEVENCYNTGEIQGEQKVGGVIGFCEGSGGNGLVMKSCVSLGLTVIATDTSSTDVGRVVGKISGSYTITDNQARTDMKVYKNTTELVETISGPGGSGFHGADVAVDGTVALSGAFSASKGWDTNIWTIPDDYLTYGCELPTLKALTGEAAPTLPGEAPMTDAEILAAVKSAIENETYTIPQADAADEEALKAALAAKLNALDIMEGKGVDCEISSPLESFTPAAAGTKDNPTGTDGSFTFTAQLTKGTESVTTNSKSGTITATAYVEPAPTVDVDEKRVYANGVPLLLVKGTNEEGGIVRTVVYIDKGTIGQLDEGIDEIIDPDGNGSMNGTTVGNDLSGWSVYGGSKEISLDGDTKITMEGGFVQNIFGGGLDSELNGNTSVTMIGGRVYNGIYGGGGGSSTVNGSASVTMIGGLVNSDVYGGGGGSSTVSGSASVTMTGGQVENNIYGGGNSGTVGGTSVEISGDAIVNRWIYGGCVSGSVTGDTWVKISGNSYVGTEVSGSGEDRASSVTGNTNIMISGGKIGKYVWGGSSQGGSVTGEKNITIGGKVEIGNRIDAGIAVGQGSTGNHVESFAIDADLIGENGCVTVRLQNNVPEGSVIATGAVKSDVAKIKLVGTPGNPMPYVPYFDSSDNTIKIKAIPVPEVYTNDIYANGLPLLLVAATPNADNTNKDYTVIYHDQDGDGVLDDGEPIVHFSVNGVDNDTTEGNDLTKFTIYGGSRMTDYTGDTSITMLGGQVYELYGGGNDVNTGGKVTGDTSVVVKGGQVVGIHGGGNLSNGINVDGNTSVVIDGGTVTGGVYGGGNGSGIITGNSTLTINGGTVLSGGSTSMVCGGRNGDVKGTASVNINGGTVNALVFGGGQYSGAAASSQVNVTGGKVTGALYGGGFQLGTTGEASVSMTGGELVKIPGDSNYTGRIYGGNYSSAAGSQTVTLGGSARVDGGVVFKGSDALNGVSSVAIASGLTGTNPISFILPSGFDASENPVIATGAVTSDLAKIKLAGPGAKGLEAYLDGTDIKAHQPYTVSVSVKEQGPYYKNDEIFLMADVRDSKTQAEMTTGIVQFYKEGTPLGDPVSYSSTSGFGKQKGFALSVICGTSSFIPELTAGNDNIIKAVYTSVSKTEVASQPFTVSVSDKMNGNNYISSMTVPNLTGDGDHYVVPIQFGVANNGGEKGIQASAFVITGTKDSLPFTDFQIDASDNTASVKVKDPGTYVFTAKLPESGSYAGTEVSDSVVVLAPYTVTYALEHLTADNQPAQVNYGKKLSATLTAEHGYRLPATVTVSMGGSPLAPYPENGYTYDSTTGVIEIAHATGDIVITADGVAKSADASLLALTYTVDGGSAAAVPGFEADRTIYDVVLPYGTSQDAVIALMGTRSDSSASITENNGAALVNGSGTATMKVTAEDGTTRTYTVNFTIAADTRSDARQITAFTIPGQVGDTVIDQNQHTITVTMPHGTDVTRLTPVITVSDKASVMPQSGAAQNFTDSVTYTVTAENETSQAYTVTVDVQAPAPTHIITASAGSGGTISPDGTVTVNEGESQTFTITAANRYRISRVTVDGVDMGAVTTYTFEHVTADHSILAEFRYIGGGSGGSSGGGGGSGGGSSPTAGTTSQAPSTTTSTTATGDGGSVTTATTTATDNSGKTTTVTTEVKKDAAGHVTGSATTVTTDNITTQSGGGTAAVTVYPNGSAINSAASAAGASAQSPADISVKLPQEAVANEIGKPDVDTVQAAVVLPKSVKDNPAVQTVGVTVEKETVDAVRQSGKRLEVTVREETGGAEAVWSLDGQTMRNAAGQSTDLNLGVRIAPVQSSDPIATPVKPPVTAGGYENGLVVSITAAGTLLSSAKLTVPATNQTGITAGTVVVVYRFDPATGALSPVPGGVCTVDANGNVTMDIPVGTRTGAKETYVLLPAPTAPQAAAVDAGGSSVHTIKEGDTLNKISAQYGCRVEDLLALNPGVDIYDLRVGSDLRVP